MGFKRGRPRISATWRLTSLRLTPEDQILLRQIGGVKWVRNQLSIIRQQKELQRGKETSI